ncbi:Sigma 54-interacting transcriptional regulator [Sulfidibacter corallicola]|uniref:Sigma 54-interacting transcriptional regulator n=1 Tax=Sulfidibacter corallicola TaxID=2818388 RepID=A0A8A4TUQ2_SULCO|nr:sigma 54-interacting transcriptional regulator [Sulfidibacter corallicola]QTD53696.1 sigma 54-interacting transcriptional regulator [Sulfidibacter corallicola]
MTRKVTSRSVVETQSPDYLETFARLDPESAYFAVNGNQIITFWSDGAETLLGYGAEEVLGKHCSQAIRCVTCSKGCGLKEYTNVSKLNLSHYRKDGSEILVQKSASAFFGNEQGFQGGIEVLKPLERPEPPLERSRSLVDFHGILTADAQFLNMLTGLRHVAHTGVNVLIRGESGTGKELVAKALHAMSPRARRAFVPINCGTLSREFLQSELFGHRRGAFTGAISDKKGLLAEADHGTLFLDEVAELPFEVQAMLLRVVQDQRYRSLGDSRDRSTDVRFISATHVSLRQAVKEKRFREDLMFRLRVVPLFLPPLRDRKIDIPLLWQHFLLKSCQRHGLPQPSSPPDLIRLLTTYPWPGNVRELINVAEMIAITCPGKVVTPQHLPPEFRESPAAPAATDQAFLPEPSSVARPEPCPPPIESWMPRSPDRPAIEAALRACEGNTSQAAKMLGISRATLWRKRKKWGLV